MLDRRQLLLLPGGGALAAIDPAQAEHEAWRKDRLARLLANDGWLTLTGLHWLDPGANRIASAPGVVFHRQGRSVRMESATPVSINRNPPVRAATLKPNDDKILVGTRTYFVILRGDRVAIRERDADSPARASFKGLELYPFHRRLRLEAKWLAYAKPVTRRIVNVAGTVDEYQAPGQAEFQLAGRTMRLEPVIEDDHLFYVFKDLTAGKTTYPAGRFMELPVAKNGIAIVDFNRAYNPPCAFTPYATCPLPLKHNHLPVAIEAGERAYHLE